MRVLFLFPNICSPANTCLLWSTAVASANVVKVFIRGSLDIKSCGWVCRRVLLTQQDKQQHVRPFDQHCDTARYTGSAAVGGTLWRPVFEFSGAGWNLQTTETEEMFGSNKGERQNCGNSFNGKWKTDVSHIDYLKLSGRSGNFFFLIGCFLFWLWSPRDFVCFGGFLRVFIYENHTIQSTLFINYLQTRVALNSSYPICSVCLQDSTDTGRQFWWATWQQDWSREAARDEVLCGLEHWACISVWRLRNITERDKTLHMYRI